MTNDWDAKQERKEKLSQRNAVAALQGLQELNGRISKINDAQIKLQRTVTEILRRLEEVEKRFLVQQSQLTGRGPTETNWM